MKTILSCSALNFVAGRLNDQELLRVTLATLPKIKDAGFDHVELYLRKEMGTDLAIILEAAEQQSLHIHSIHYSKPMLNKETKTSMVILLCSITMTACLGACLGVIHPPTQNLDLSSSLDICRQVLSLALPKAEEMGVILTLENLNGPLYLELISRLLEEFPSPSLGVTMDLKFLYASGNSLEEYFQAFGNRIVNIHVNEYTGSLLDAQGKRHYPKLGSGQVDFVKLRELLLGYQYRGALTLESAFSAEHPEEIVNARVMMQSLIK